MADSKAQQKLEMLIFTTIAYGYLDYTSLLLEHKLTKTYITMEQISQIQTLIEKTQKSIYPVQNGNRAVFNLLLLLANIFRPSYQGWASTEIINHLGSRKRGKIWY